MYAVCFVMWLFHGIVLDILLIGLLPFLSADRSDAQRADKFIWALGGYEGYPKVPNLGPTHRRFITENAAYALLRASPAIFITNGDALRLCPGVVRDGGAGVGSRLRTTAASREA